MRYLDIGTTRKISKIGLGAWQFGSRDWGYGDQYAEQVAHAIVRRALELGVTLFDTAEIYGFGRSERIPGKALGEDRESVFLATKIFPLVPVAPVVEQRAVASANRLGVRRLDLYQVHQANPLSYSLVARSPERDLLPFAESHDRMVIAYSPLAQGLLSGRYHRGNRPANRLRAASPLFLPDNLDRAGDLIATLREVADAHSATPSQIALAWVIHRPAVVAIPGAASVEQLEGNVAAAEIRLGDDEYQALQAASDRFSPITGPAALPRMARVRLGR